MVTNFLHPYVKCIASSTPTVYIVPSYVSLVYYLILRLGIPKAYIFADFAFFRQIREMFRKIFCYPRKFHHANFFLNFTIREYSIPWVSKSTLALRGALFQYILQYFTPKLIKREIFTPLTLSPPPHFIAYPSIS